ncbi:hypothetical protein KY284_020364 [Solanum tuberosum]|nr:hypothetical protein KY284_020364 [Solanum tuberosum]
MVHTDSPNSTLHDIITHKVIETESKDSKEEQISTFSNSKEEQIFKDADLSPRVMKVVKAAKKGKKQCNGESAQPGRIQPKRQTTSQKSSSQ